MSRAPLSAAGKWHTHAREVELELEASKLLCDELVGALEAATKAIASLDEDIFGMQPTPDEESVYPIRNELLYTLKQALAKAKGKKE